MKYLYSKLTSLLFLLVLPILGLAGPAYSPAAVSFYATPLVCGAAPEIGCGTRAKPMLVELMKNKHVREAWLNRPGTVVAVVWEDGFDKDKKRSAIVDRVSRKYSLDFQSVENSKDHFTAFTNGEKWYKGEEVDKLSIEEAGVIADTVVAGLLRENVITEEMVSPMRKDVEAYFKTELVKYRTKEELESFDTQYQWYSEIVRIGERYVGEGNMPDLTTNARGVLR